MANKEQAVREMLERTGRSSNSAVTFQDYLALERGDEVGTDESGDVGAAGVAGEAAPAPGTDAPPAVAEARSGRKRAAKKSAR